MRSDMPCGGDAFVCSLPGCPVPRDATLHRADKRATERGWTPCRVCDRAEPNGGKCAGDRPWLMDHDRRLR